jgi:hypothetical protein
MKKKKHELILMYLKRQRSHLERYCEMNNCEPTPYMEGSLKIINETLEYINSLNNGK